ncbi:hypothetical protein ATANTOWER_009968 [Ataeniobius toweri]|uniref:C2H2-type domain-containing protein n=3 Tax=Goodeidae TaxID=28758 RepID=A0ABU7ANB3_9TELE|nr:hypothetical protein [Ataeniobius toweri]
MLSSSLLCLSGVALASRTGNLSTSEIITPTTPTSSSHSRLGGAPTPHLISGLAGSHGIEPGKTNGGFVGLLGPPPKQERGRKKIKAENGSSLLVVPYPILASDQSCVTITAKEGKTYRCKVCPLTFFSKSDMQIHSKTHTEAKAHKCPHCTKTFANSSYLAQHLRIHLGLKPYRCSYCERCFRQLSHLQQHTRIHTGDRPYKCLHPGCEKAFTQLSNLQVNMSCFLPVLLSNQLSLIQQAELMVWKNTGSMKLEVSLKMALVLSDRIVMITHAELVTCPQGG